MRSRGLLEIAKSGNSSLMPYAPQGVTGRDDDDDDDDCHNCPYVHLFARTVLYPGKGFS
jgi:hypothetical protein